MSANPQDDSSWPPVVLTYRPAEKKREGRAEPSREPERVEGKAPGLPANEGRRSQMTTDRSPPGQARQPCSSARCCSASSRQHPRSDGTIGALFGEPRRRFESRLREGEMEVRSP
jgi:hypothetical protein